MKMHELDKKKPLREYLIRVVDRIDLGFNVWGIEKDRANDQQRMAADLKAGRRAFQPKKRD